MTSSKLERLWTTHELQFLGSVVAHSLASLLASWVAQLRSRFPSLLWERVKSNQWVKSRQQRESSWSSVAWWPFKTKLWRCYDGPAQSDLGSLGFFFWSFSRHHIAIVKNQEQHFSCGEIYELNDVKKLSILSPNCWQPNTSHKGKINDHFLLLIFMLCAVLNIWEFDSSFSSNFFMLLKSYICL